MAGLNVCEEQVGEEGYWGPKRIDSLNAQEIFVSSTSTTTATLGTLYYKAIPPTAERASTNTWMPSARLRPASIPKRASTTRNPAT